jgi:dipeptidyl aminopeptidase/acylaminoacyl peptidase
MSTQKSKPDPGSLDRRRAPQLRRGVGRKARAFAAAAAIGLVAVACTPGPRDGQSVTAPAGQPETVYPADPKAEEVATGFVKAFGAFDADRAITYLADDADLQLDVTTPEDLPLLTSFLEAQGYEQILVEACRVTGSFSFGTEVRCRFDFHAIRSDEIGLGPYRGSYWDLTVRDGEIAEVSLDWEIAKFSPQMWEPFADWVSAKHPKDFEAMYMGGGSNFSLTEQSIRLWKQRSREYVNEVWRTRDVSEADHVLDLRTGEMTPLPRAILRSLGETGRGSEPESQYAASSDGSMLAFVGTGADGTLQIFVAGIDGTGVRQMTHDPTGATWPAWSPDGTMIAYARSGTEESTGLFVLDVATGESTQVTDETASFTSFHGLQFTPDGSSLLYTGGTERKSGGGTIGGELRTVPIAGGRSTLLIGPEGDASGDLANAVNGSLSPDGSLVTFKGVENFSSRDVQRWVANADGTGRRELQPCYNSIPAGTWSPDGSRIVCNKDVPYDTILVVDVTTGDARRVARGLAAIWLDDHTLLVEI